MPKSTSFDELARAFMDKAGHENTFSSIGSPLSDPTFGPTVRRDLRLMRERLELDVDEDLEIPLLVQSILGHAMMGHCEFYRHPHYRNATIADIIHAAGLDMQRIKRVRYDLIDKVGQWINLAFGERPPTRLTLKNTPLLGVDLLRDYNVDPVYVLKGMVLAGFMDNFEYRTKTMAEHPETISKKPLIIGGGESYLVDIKRTRLFTDFWELANKEHTTEDIDYLRDLGIVVDKTIRGRRVEPAYIRRREGPGTSDDLAFIMIGEMYRDAGIDKSISAMLGAFVIDAVDTYDKCVTYPKEGGLDEALAANIQEGWRHKHGKPLVDDQTIMRLIYYAAKGNVPRVSVSSSHRMLVEYRGTSPVATMENHIRHVQGRRVRPFPVGFERVPSPKLYTVADIRAAHMHRAA